MRTLFLTVGLALAGDVAWADDPNRAETERAEARRICRVDLRRRLAEREPLPSGRQTAAGQLLTAYAELLPLELPEKRPEVPKVKPLSPDVTAKERAEFAVLNTLRRDAQYVSDLIDARDDVVTRLRELFKTDPDELKKLVEKKLPKEVAAELMKRVK